WAESFIPRGASADGELAAARTRTVPADQVAQNCAERCPCCGDDSDLCWCNWCGVWVCAGRMTRPFGRKHFRCCDACGRSYYGVPAVLTLEGTTPSAEPMGPPPGARSRPDVRAAAGGPASPANGNVKAVPQPGRKLLR